MKQKYTEEQHRRYFIHSRNTGRDWLDAFSGNTDFYATHYWELLTDLWLVGKPVMVSDALRYMKSIKSPFTARKYLQKAIEGGLVLEKKNPVDERSTLIELSEDMRARINVFFDKAVGNVLEAAEILGKLKS